MNNETYIKALEGRISELNKAIDALKEGHESFGNSVGKITPMEIDEAFEELKKLQISKHLYPIDALRILEVFARRRGLIL